MIYWISGYLIIGLIIALVAVASLWALREIHHAEPEPEDQDVIDQLGLPRLVLELIVAWPLALIVWARRMRDGDL